MAIDDERREIARRLRDAVGRLIDMGGLAEILGFHRCSWSAGMLADRLADLIEPEPERTARMEYDEVHCDCVCTSCGERYESDMYAAVADDDSTVLMPMRYCTYCGALVMDE